MIILIMIKIKVESAIRALTMKITITSILLFFTLIVHSQLISKRGYVGFKTSAGIIDTAFYMNYGITGEYLMKNKFGLIYNLEFQKRSDNYKQIHGSIGSLGGPPLILIGLLSGISNSSNDGNSSGSVFGLGYLGLVMGILVTILPDGVSYHIPFRYNGDIAPYANVLGFDYVWNKKANYSEWKYSCSFGVKASYWHFSNWMLQGFVETRKVAFTGWGIGAGLGCSYSFGNTSSPTSKL